MELSAGRTLGAYRLIERVEPVGSAEIWRVRRFGLDRALVLRVLPPLVSGQFEIHEASIWLSYYYMLVIDRRAYML